MQRIILGTGPGKTVGMVNGLIHVYKGKIIFISAMDNTEYLQLDKLNFQTVQVDKINEIKEFERIHINENCVEREMSDENRLRLFEFIKAHLHDKDTLIVIDEAGTMKEYIYRILAQENVTASVIIVVRYLGEIEKSFKANGKVYKKPFDNGWRITELINHEF